MTASGPPKTNSEPEDDEHTEPAADTAAAAPHRHTPAAARAAHVADVAAPP